MVEVISKMNSLRYLLVLVLFGSLSAVENVKIIYCYFGTWANYRPGLGKFEPENVNAHLCTHLSYSFFGIADTGEFKILDSWLDIDLNFIKRSIALKDVNPNLKILTAVGGWNEGSTKYSLMAADPDKRSKFIQSTLKFIQQYGFDGLDLDWEYPAQRGGSTQDKTNFVTLLKELKETLTPLNLQLGIAVGASASTATLSYDIPNIAKYVDFINVMTYDLGMASDGVLGFNAPLRGQGANNVENCIQFWLNSGAPASKLILGLAFYGRTFQLSNPAQTTPGSPSAGAGSPGPFTREAGFLGYNEICTLESSWTTVFDSAHGVPYMYKDNQWVGYDNVHSLDLKLDLLNSLNLGGAMLWSIETDDFRGECGEKFPLLQAINRKVGSNSESQTNTTQMPSTTTSTREPEVSTTTPPTLNSTSGSNCYQDGFFVHESDCTRFYRCVNGVRYDFTCSPGLHFDVNSSSCNYPNVANCSH